MNQFVAAAASLLGFKDIGAGNLRWVAAMSRRLYRIDVTVVISDYGKTGYVTNSTSLTLCTLYGRRYLRVVANSTKCTLLRRTNQFDANRLIRWVTGQRQLDFPGVLPQLRWLPACLSMKVTGPVRLFEFSSAILVFQKCGLPRKRQKLFRLRRERRTRDDVRCRHATP